LVGREDTGTLSINHMRAFRPSFSKAETEFKWRPIMWRAIHARPYFPGYPKSTMVLPSAVTAFELAAPALLPAAASVSIRLRAFDVSGNVVEVPGAFTCEAGAYTRSHSRST